MFFLFHPFTSKFFGESAFVNHCDQRFVAINQFQSIMIGLCWRYFSWHNVYRWAESWWKVKKMYLEMYMLIRGLCRINQSGSGRQGHFNQYLFWCWQRCGSGCLNRSISALTDSVSTKPWIKMLALAVVDRSGQALTQQYYSGKLYLFPDVLLCLSSRLLC